MPRRSLSGCRRRCAGGTRGSEAWHRPWKHHGRRAGDAGADLLPRSLCDRALGDAGRPRGRTAERSPHRRAGRGGPAMSLRIFVSRDAGAVAVGADEVALVLGLAARKRGTEIEIIRTGSRGLYWLEPMIEITPPPPRSTLGPSTEFDA